MRTIQKLTGIFKNCPNNLESVRLKDYILAILSQFVICLGFTRICREIVDVAIYALYPESFCGGNLAIRKVFAFSDSACANLANYIKLLESLIRQKNLGHSINNPESLT